MSRRKRKRGKKKGAAVEAKLAPEPRPPGRGGAARGANCPEAEPPGAASPSLPDRLRAGADAFFRSRWGPPAALAALVIVLYARSIDDPLIYWDDNLYILEDARIQELSPGNAWRILTESYAANYHPLTTVTFAIDRAMWGDRLAGFHITQLAFYAAAVVLLFYVFRTVLGSAPAALRHARDGGAEPVVHDRAAPSEPPNPPGIPADGRAGSGRSPRTVVIEPDEGAAALRRAQDGGADLVEGAAAFAGACLYAAHTIHVESVAWLASRKDVVCLVFYAAAILAYFRYAKEKDRPWRYYALFAALAAAAMLSKGYAAVLPAVLLVYDWCLARRLGLRQVLDKLPLFALGGLLTIFMIRAQEKDAAPLGEIAAGHRLVAQLKIYLVYVARTILPVELTIDYRHVVRTDWLGLWAAVLGACLVAASVTAFFLLRKRLPAAAWGLAIWFGQLATVMSTFFTLRQWMTDRYLFFPTVGSTLAVTAAGLWLYRNGGVPDVLRRKLLPAAAAVVVVIYATLTVLRLGDWRSELTIWSDAVRKQQGIPGSGPLELGELQGQTFSDLGALLRVLEAYKREGRLTEARKLRDAIGEVPPDLARGHEIQLARHDIEAGRYDEAIRRLTPVAERGRFSARRAWVWLGEAQRLKGEPEKAREAYLKSLEMTGEGGRAAGTVMVEIGNLDFAAGRHEEAAEWYALARGRVGPRNPRPAFFLGLAYERMGRLEEAQELCEGTLHLEGKVPANVPFNFADVYLELGVIAKKLGRTEDAVRRHEQALERGLPPGRGVDAARAKAVRRELEFLRRRLDSERGTPP